MDTQEKLAACGAQALRKKSADHIKHDRFDGVPPTTREAEHTVDMAAYLKRGIEF